MLSVRQAQGHPRQILAVQFIAANGFDECVGKTLPLPVAAVSRHIRHLRGGGEMKNPCLCRGGEKCAIQDLNLEPAD